MSLLVEVHVIRMQSGEDVVVDESSRKVRRSHCWWPHAPNASSVQHRKVIVVADETWAIRKLLILGATAPASRARRGVQRSPRAAVEHVVNVEFCSLGAERAEAVATVVVVSAQTRFLLRAAITYSLIGSSLSIFTEIVAWKVAWHLEHPKKTHMEREKERERERES